MSPHQEKINELQNAIAVLFKQRHDLATALEQVRSCLTPDCFIPEAADAIAKQVLDSVAWHEDE